MFSNKLKLLAILIAMLALLFAVNAFADGADGIIAPPKKSQPESFDSATIPSVKYIPYSTQVELLELFYDAAKDASLSIDLSSYGFPYTQDYANDLWAIWDYLPMTYRDVEYYTSAFYPSVRRYGNTNILGEFYIEDYYSWAGNTGKKNPISVSEIKQTNQLIEAEIDEIISTIIYDGMSDFEKVLAVHDYICLNAEYEPLYETNYSAIPRTSYDIRGILLYGVGVCQSYTWTFQEIMEELGIPCGASSSDDMNHTWNQVKIDGEWYHMDITWDDPTGDCLGRANHDNFLCSDSDFVNNKGHYGFYTEPTFFNRSRIACDSTKFDNAFWGDVSSPMYSLNNKVYFIDTFKDGNYTRGMLRSWDVYTGAVENIYTITDVWYDTQPGFYWTSNFSKLAYYDGRFYFNTPTAIKSIKPNGTDLKTVADLSNVPRGYNIYGIMIKDHKLYYAQSTEAYVSLPDKIGATGYVSLKIEITSISLPTDAMKILRSFSMEAVCTVNSGADPSRVIWSTSNPLVLSFKDGNMLALGYGTVVVTASSPDRPDVKATMTVTVYEKISFLSLALNSKTMYVGTTVLLKALLNDGALRSDLAWSVSDSSVMTVDSDGCVKVLKVGSATVTAKSKEDPSIYATLTVTVEDGRPGDPNGDGEVDARDSVLVAQFLANWQVAYDMSIADVNADGNVDAKDSVRLAQYLAGWDVQLGVK